MKMLMQRLTRGHAGLTIWRGPELFGGREVTDFELNQLDVSPTLPRCAGGKSVRARGIVVDMWLGGATAELDGDGDALGKGRRPFRLDRPPDPPMT
jgi:hypothetical protein